MLQAPLKKQELRYRALSSANCAQLTRNLLIARQLRTISSITA